MCLYLFRFLGYTDPRSTSDLAKYHITQCVFSYEYGVALSKNAQEHGVEVVIHIKIDSGIGRIGFQGTEDDLERAADVCCLPNMKIEGIFTHFASADEGDGGKEIYTWSI